MPELGGALANAFLLGSDSALDFLGQQSGAYWKRE
jgi:hypothetical protein